MSEHLLFLTGKLARERLHDVLKAMPGKTFTYEIKNIGVNVAALMTAEMIKRRLSLPEPPDQVILPGLCRGDIKALSVHFGVPFVHGPIDVKDVPAFFGHAGKRPDLSRHDVQIFAEIVDAPHLTVAAIVARAEQYRCDGADVIDLGCLPDTPFPHLEESVVALHEAGFLVSVDSLEDEMLLRGGGAGADYLLSLTEKTCWIADEVPSTPVVIPEPHGDMDSLYRVIERFTSARRSFLADCVLDPIHFGLTQSLLRYDALRRRYADVAVIMGVGNLTELTEADTTGINAILFGIISELRLNAVLTTEVSPHARRAVSEADAARRMMYAARSEGALPKDFDDRLLTTHARKPFPYKEAEIATLAEAIKDPSYRIEVSSTGIHVYNRDGLINATDPFALFPDLAELRDDPSHAFYMGVELARAQIAWQLGKRYIQDRGLSWGIAVPVADEED